MPRGASHHKCTRLIRSSERIALRSLPSLVKTERRPEACRAYPPTHFPCWNQLIRSSPQRTWLPSMLTIHFSSLGSQ